MPYIAVRTTKSLSLKQIEELKTNFGKNLPVIPGKTEAGLMVDITGDVHLYHGGEARDLAFVEIRCFGPTAFEAKQAFAKTVFEALESIIGVAPGNVYYNHVDLDTWGSRGVFRQY